MWWIDCTGEVFIWLAAREKSSGTGLVEGAKAGGPFFCGTSGREGRSRLEQYPQLEREA